MSATGFLSIGSSNDQAMPETNGATMTMATSAQRSADCPSLPRQARVRVAAQQQCRGMTLVEMLVAMASTLLLMGLIAQLFGVLGRGVNGSRNIVELGDRIRSVQYSLRHDLAGATAAGATPPIDPALGLGYFEIIEGPETDRLTVVGGEPVEKDIYFRIGKQDYGNKAAFEAWRQAVQSDDRLVGDIDDILIFTTRSTADLFKGKATTGGDSLQSPYAEVCWFCRPMPNMANPRLYSLYRRQRLVMAHPGTTPFINPTSDLTSGSAINAPDGGVANSAPLSARNAIDVSCRVEGGRLVPNTLADLTKRENRFLHEAAFPHLFDWDSNDLPLQEPRLGEDVVLTNVLAFDVRVYDPNAIVKFVGTGPAAEALQPGEAGYQEAAATDSLMRGAFVDLNWFMPVKPGSQRRATNPAAFLTNLGTVAEGQFSRLGLAVRNNHATLPPHLLQRATYDTWSTHYEHNGRDDDSNGVIDQGTNGFDDNNNQRVDEPAEAETQPPYPVRLRGLEIRIRCLEPVSGQIRQVTVRQNF